MLKSMISTAVAALLVFASILIPRCVAQDPPDYDVPSDSLVTTSGTTRLPTSYTLTNPACTGTAATCPCAGGYVCVTITDCHWKCLMTSFPSFSYAPTTTPPSVSASGTSVTAVPTTSVPGGGTTAPGSSPSVTRAPSSSTTSGGSSGVPTSRPSGSQSGGGQSSSNQGGTSRDQSGGGGGPGGSTRTGGQQSATSAPGQSVVTVTEYPTTCPKRTGTKTVFNTDSVSSCPATCPT